MSNIPCESFDLAQWPVTTKGLVVPHDGRFGLGSIEALRSNGYKPVDVRFLEGPEAIRLTLRGARMGTVRIDKSAIDALRLEAAVLGMMSGKNAGDDKVLDLLDTMSTINILESVRDHTLPLTELRRQGAGGRPQGTRDQTPRKLRKDKPKRVP